MATTPPETRPLRKGWTTGACATAAASAAYTALLTGRFPDPVVITLPGGEEPAFPLVRAELGNASATAAVVKDAGDDPDVTHGAIIVATVARGAPDTGVTFRAGDGVGTVTRPGLPLAVGEPAINPAPRRMMARAIASLAERHGGDGDACITIAVAGGRELAARTWNPRLGIEGGLSILGTTGIVIPYSCSAWIHAIHRGIDVARAAGLGHLAGATGSTSEAAVQRLHRLPDLALIDMGDFCGGMLKYLRRHPVPRVTIAGGFAKMAKLAAGHLDLHSGRSRLDPGFIATLAREGGAGSQLVAALRAAGGGGEALGLARGEGFDLAQPVAERARTTALATLPDARIDVVVVDREGTVIAHADP
jgi:cobalt-precorrin-5B (C1)-methyltransferase